MAQRTVRWTLNAIQDKIDIYKYWIERNKSTQYVENLDQLFDEAMELVSIFPLTGLLTKKENYRVQLVERHKLVYKITEKNIEVVSVWGPKENWRLPRTY